VNKTPKAFSLHENNTLASSVPVQEARNRTISGETLVEGIDKALDLEWKVGDLTAGFPEIKPENKEELKVRRQSARLGGLARAVSVVASKASSLGKRSREMMENGKEKIQALAGSKRSLRSRTSVNEVPEAQKPPRKKARVDQVAESQSASASPVPVIVKPIQKKHKQWLTTGLYVGQEQDFDARFTNAQNARRRSAKAIVPAPKPRTFLPMPMFTGRTLLSTNRDFRLPFDVYSPAQRMFGQCIPTWAKRQPSK